MLDTFGNLFVRKPAHKGLPLIAEKAPAARPARREPSERRQTFSKVFRWHLPDGQTEPPGSVEVVGTFTHWQKVPLLRDSALDGWHATVHHIQGNRTHHYMLLLDGKPSYDKNCDGFAIPHGPDEERYQVMTAKGPRVLMLFAQTK
jgi:hypothetical protein